MASFFSLLIQETKAQIYARGLAVAADLGLPVTSWIAGDPTRSLYWYLAETLEALEVMVAGYVSSGFLDYASGDWLALLAKQLYNVDKVEATYAETSVVLTNSGGGLYTIEPGDVVVKSATSGKTYTNTSGGTLASGPGTTLALDFVADEAGAASTALPTEIDTMVTVLLGVTCSNPLAAVGLDAEQDEALRDRCRAKLGMLSPNGPRGAYDYVVRTSALTMVQDITRSRTNGDSTTGDVVVYVAGAGGAVDTASVTAAQTAVEKWATPLCITPSVQNCSTLLVSIAYELWLYTSVGATVDAIKAQVAADLLTMFAERPIGGDIIAPATTGTLYQSLIASTIRAAYPDAAFRVLVTSPAGDTAMAINQVATINGTPTANIHLESDP